mmetsp:Transcript_9900/g.26910  ORF Transcript_9900/g.26910 Transcript_9900/m.26910 type:complete len:232 (-) Transcript_9900:38-733(-)
MHFSRLRWSRSTLSESSKFENQTSIRMDADRAWASLSTKRIPVIISAGSMVPPIMPRTMLFQYSSTVPPPSETFNWNWKWPPLELMASSHSGLMPSLKTISASTTFRAESAPSLTNFLPSSSSLGWGRWFQYFQKPLTVLKEATRWVVSEYWAVFESVACMICSQIVQVYRRAGSLAFISSSSAGFGEEHCARVGEILLLKLRYCCCCAMSRGSAAATRAAGTATSGGGPV